jgi:hypothetical protein
MRILSVALPLVAAVSMIGAPAQATATISLANNNCSLATGCLFTGNVASSTIADIQSVYNALPGADITLNYLASTDDGFAGNGALGGTWSLPGFDVSYIAVKAGDQFMLYSLAAAASSGTWSTAGLVNTHGNKHPQLGLSHLVFFGTATPIQTGPGQGGGDDAISAVPESASWALMLSGFGLLGAALRRDRRRQIRFS